MERITEQKINETLDKIDAIACDWKRFNTRMNLIYLISKNGIEANNNTGEEECRNN